MIIYDQKMIQLVAEIQQANADAPDIFDYIVEAFEIVMVRFVRCVMLISTFFNSDSEYFDFFSFVYE